VSSPPAAFDPFDPAVKRDPYPFYAVLRRETPVAHLPAKAMWAVSRHADVAFALKRPDLFSSSINADRAEIPARETLLGSDPPDHTALRKRVERAFTPRRVRALEPRLDALARELVAGFAARSGCDAIADLASPLPVIVIAELMGVDPARHSEFKLWADAIIARGTGRPSALDRATLDARAGALKTYLAQVIEARRGSSGDDLVSALVRDDGDVPALSPAQALNFAVLLLLGGSETTTHLIGNGLRALLADADALARVRAQPALLADAVDEALRFDAPVQSVFRRTTAEVELGGQRLPAGATVILLLGSANRDEAVFDQPDRFRLDRPDLKHLAFGLGPHYCLGATLARMEAQAALQALLALPNLRLAGGDAELVDSFVLRGPRALPLAFGG
jgi:cytochrome P450